MPPSDPSQASSSLLSQNRLSQMAWFLTLLMAVALTCAKALLSIGTGLLGGVSLLYLIRYRDLSHLRQNSHALVVGLLFLLALVAGLHTEDQARWLIDLKGKLLFLAIPVSLAILPPFTRRQYLYVFYAFILSCSVVAALSLGYYLGDYQQINPTLGRNAYIDIVGSISHIYFGMMLAFSVLLALVLWRKGLFIRHGWERKLLLGLAMFNLICLHVFVSRTGYLTFYAGLLLWGAHEIWARKAWLLGLGLAAFLVLAPVLSYWLLPSFQQRVAVTIWDMEQYLIENQDLTSKSLSLRFLAWETAWRVFEQHPIVGVGMADLEAEMRAQYIRDRARAHPEGRNESPHNQFLEYLAGHGLIGISLFLLVLAYPFYAVKGCRSIFFGLFFVTILSAMMFESLLERQIGITFFAIFMVLIPVFQRNYVSPQT